MKVVRSDPKTERMRSADFLLQGWPVLLTALHAANSKSLVIAQNFVGEENE